MMKTTRLMCLSALMMGVMAMVSGCLDGNTFDDCDPELDEACVCEDIDGLACDDPTSLDCDCFLLDEEALEDEIEEEAPEYRYVLIEDLTNPVSGDSPGADIDAVSILKGDRELYATSVEDHKAGGERNNYNDITELLGAPDSDCEKKNFVSLGGEAFGGYVMVSFGTPEEDALIENGDTVKVYEIGRTMCPGTRFDNDPYRVSVSVSDDLGAFVEVGTGGDGRNLIPVTGL